MFSNFMIGALVGIGFGGWVYSKMMRNTGGNTGGSLTAAALTGILATLAVTTVLGLIS